MTAVIALEEVDVRFGDVEAVRGVSFEVERGELLMLVGGSGSGKTTTLKTINRLVEPSAGRILLDGREVRERVPHELRREVGYCFQRIGLFPHMTVEENVGITPKLLGWPEAKIRARVEELLELVELPAADYGQRMPRELSGGQQQRVGVARALAAEPEVVLFDEPFGALDPIIRGALQRAVLAIRERISMTGVFVTHDVLEALTLGDRIGVMRDGELLQVGTPRQLRAAPADPYVTDLLETPERALRALTGEEE